ncbi:AraC family transcriptional regulator [Mesocricetibacter intestinalis]|uniref:AraC family transcriptional regulator n=1 Tax=Mesocricetibacter intestinalis TaxID=1521930 RepID=A0A4R6VGP9_9PAST|nr:helix-turn-helix transcriptional regulator [Mesocricetibacter intestinalis]TDQ57135.1 AraC family transcriptional regulator [Mesocricetibacter intestinalis]
MSIEYLNSSQFIRLVRNDSGPEFLKGSYRFDEFKSGISIHGGMICPQKNMRCGQLVGSYINFIVLLEGSLSFAINGLRYHIAAEGGRIIMVSPGEECLFTRYLIKDEPCVKVSVKGVEKWFSQYAPQQKQPAVFERTVRIWSLPSDIRQLSLGFLQPQPATIYNDLCREANALELLAKLWRVFEDNCKDYTDAPLPKGDNEFVRRLNSVFLHKQNVTQLAQAMNMSERTLQRRIKEYFGLSIGDWLRHKKMKYALHALSNTPLSISEVAYECGYRHVSNFTQAFKQYFHCTPAELKNGLSR